MPSIDTQLEKLEIWQAAMKPFLATQIPNTGRSPHRMGVHLINSAERDLQYIAQLAPAMVRMVNPDPAVVRRILTTTPAHTLVNLRNHLRSEEKAQAVADPTGTGVRHANEWIAELTTGRFKEFAGNKRIVVVGINEPGVHDLASELGVYHYNVAFLNRLTAAGIRGMALSLSVGWPREVGGVVQWDTFRPLGPIINAGDHLLNLQSYFYPTPQTNWDKLMNRVATCPLQVPIVFAEVGYTRQLNGLPQPWGWRGNISAAQYAEYLWYCADNVDPRVLALCPFTSGFGGPEWESKDVTSELITQILSRKHDYNWPIPVEPPMSDPKLLLLPKMVAITDFFGQLYNGISHSGVDISAVTGTPIYCPYPGATVAWVGTVQEASPYGLYIRVSLPAPLGIDILFAHNREVLVKPGEVLPQGKIMAYSDSTGNSTGPHIHMEFRQKDLVTGTYKTGVSSHINASIDPFGYIAGWIASGNRVEFKG
jgi:hypothetical protein